MLNFGGFRLVHILIRLCYADFAQWFQVEKLVILGYFRLCQVPDIVVHEEEVYEDEDDENDEGNWRNDYPDEESDLDSDREERYVGMYLQRI